MNRRLLAFFLTIAILLIFLPTDVWAVDTDCGSHCEATEIVLPDTYFEANNIIGFGIDSPDILLLDTSDFGTKSDAIADLRQAMIERADTITVYFTSTNADGKEEALDLLEQAMDHTGNPVEGDYLRWHRSDIGYGYYEDPYYSNGVYYQTAMFNLTYYTTAQQEAEMTDTVNTLLDNLNLDGKDDYQKFSAIYDYVCANITYDYEHLYDDNYTLKQSAYAALINGTSVCQGYASLLYRLLLEVGIDCRVISGDGGGPHGWNIVKIGDYYYNVDATWDAGTTPEHYDYCLVTDADFGNHTRNPEYATAEFYAAYPMAASDYVYNPHNMTYYHARNKTCTTNGSKSYYYCSHCDKYFQDKDATREIEKYSWIIPAGHQLENVAYKAPTTAATGNETHYKCDDCGNLYWDADGQQPATEQEVTIDKLSAVTFGDADGDGYVDAFDASQVMKYSVGAISADELNVSALDVDGDGYVDAFDASLIQKYSVGAIEKFPVASN